MASITRRERNLEMFSLAATSRHMQHHQQQQQNSAYQQLPFKLHQAPRFESKFYQHQRHHNQNRSIRIRKRSFSDTARCSLLKANRRIHHDTKIRQANKSLEKITATLMESFKQSNATTAKRTCAELEETTIQATARSQALKLQTNSVKLMKIEHHHPSNDSKLDFVAKEKEQEFVDDSKPIQVARSRDSRHLVRTVADLPVFVTIEGYRIASYIIAGEPFLCLPQLLQNIKQKFPLEKIIDTFEETVICFTSSTPKQVEGFVKTSALPPGADTCPLIKLSDADRVCLRLFDQISREKCGRERTSVTSERPITNSNRLNEHQFGESRRFNLITTRNADEREVQSCNDETEESSTKLSSNKKEESAGASKLIEDHSSQLNDENSELKLHEKHDLESITETLFASGKKSSRDIKCRETDGLSTREGNQILEGCVEPLFDSEAQASILNLARSVTSTLMIQIYHRCFGKCVGLYYPSLLVDTESSCIECASCHSMMSPKRFVGHTHGLKEVNVCHWGFNSYDWRYYIRLSRKQTMNNLDDDELLVQFNTLQTIADKDEHMLKSGSNLVVDNQLQKTKIDKISNELSNHETKGLDYLRNSSENPSVSEMELSRIKELHETFANQSDRHQTIPLNDQALRNSLDNCFNPKVRPSSSSTRRNYMDDNIVSKNIGTMAANLEAISRGRNLSLIRPSSPTLSLGLNERASGSKSRNQFDHTSRASAIPGSRFDSIASLKNLVENSQLTINPQMVGDLQTSLLNAIKTNQNLARKQVHSSSILINESYYPGSPKCDKSKMFGRIAGNDSSSIAENYLDKDVYVATCMASYLRTLGFNAELISSIVDNMLVFMSNSKNLPG